MQNNVKIAGVKFSFIQFENFLFHLFTQSFFFCKFIRVKTNDEHQKVNNRLPDCTDATTKTINYYHKASNNVSQTQRDVFVHIFMKSLWGKRGERDRTY